MCPKVYPQSTFQMHINPDMLLCLLLIQSCSKISNPSKTVTFSKTSSFNETNCKTQRRTRRRIPTTFDYKLNLDIFLNKNPPWNRQMIQQSLKANQLVGYHAGLTHVITCASSTTSGTGLIWDMLPNYGHHNPLDDLDQ